MQLIHRALKNPENCDIQQPFGPRGVRHRNLLQLPCKFKPRHDNQTQHYIKTVQMPLVCCINSNISARKQTRISLISFLCIAPVLYSPVIHTNCDFAKRQDMNQNCPSFTSHVEIHVFIIATPLYRQACQFKSVPFPLYTMHVSHFLIREVKLLSYQMTKLAKFLKLSTDCRNTKFYFLPLHFW
jgi:hypothetical protein